jgi:hypothetical protein
MVQMMTPTLTLELRKQPLANQRAFSPHIRDSETSETSAVGQFSWYRETRSLGFKLIPTLIFYYITTTTGCPLRIIQSQL